MEITVSKLREDIYRILDQVLESGEPVVIRRRGKLLRIIPGEQPRQLPLRSRPEFLRCDPEELIHVDWSSEWRP
jgi:antitoxin (DNA-binding transcriptional repressor) of toxin-antitoxin stability system